MLTKSEILKEIEAGSIIIDEFCECSVKECSYDVHLHNEGLAIFERKLDFKNEPKTIPLLIQETGTILHPNNCYLLATSEVVNSNKFAMKLEGVSSVARMFVQIHTAGLIEPGFHGRITLEVTVQRPTIVYPKMRIGQLCFIPLTGDVALYEGRYKDISTTAVASLASQDFTDNGDCLPCEQKKKRKMQQKAK